MVMSRPGWHRALAGVWSRPKACFSIGGDNGAFKAFTIGSVRDRNALVFFLNGASGLSIIPDLIAAFLPGNRPSLDWLDYRRHDSPVTCLLRDARARGVLAVWREMEIANLKTDEYRSGIDRGRPRRGQHLASGADRGTLIHRLVALVITQGYTGDDLSLAGMAAATQRSAWAVK
jgi:hypothetical protein